LLLIPQVTSLNGGLQHSVRLQVALDGQAAHEHALVAGQGILREAIDFSTSAIQFDKVGTVAHEHTLMAGQGILREAFFVLPLSCTPIIKVKKNQQSRS